MTTSSASLGLINLQEEPQRYAYEAECISNDLDTLVLENYKIFIENMTCSVRLQSEDNVLAASLNTLKTELNTLSSVTIKDLRKSLNEFLTSYSRNKKTLQQHIKLIEFLEVPQLIDACVRNEFYDEALELSSFVFGLVQRSILIKENTASGGASGAAGAPVGAGAVTAGGGVIGTIVDEVIQLLHTLRAHLLGNLLSEQSQGQSQSHGGDEGSSGSGASAAAAAISLPQQMEIVGTVRKIDSLLLDRQAFLAEHSGAAGGSPAAATDRLSLQSAAKTHLQMEYLQARGVWLQRRIAASSATAGNSSSGGSRGDGSNSNTRLSSYGVITELIDTTRTCLYSIIIEYKALFEDDETSNVTASDVTSAAAGAGRQSNSRLVLHAWVMDQVTRVLGRLESYLLDRDDSTTAPGPCSSAGDGAALDGTSYRALFEQCLYLNLRLKSVGFNVHELVCQTFSHCVFARLSRRWGVALVQFKSMIATERVQVEDSGGGGHVGSGGGYAPKEQVAPLYWDQKQRRAGGSDAASTAAADATVARVELLADALTVPPLHHVTSFPPLAFILNSLLAGFNFIKECNLIGLREGLLGELRVMCLNVCAAVCSIAKDLRLRGNKYLSNLPPEAAARMGGSTAQPLQMDTLYSRVFVTEFVPYVLYCFERLYFAAPDAARGGRSAGRGRMLVLPINDLSGLYEGSATGEAASVSVLSPDSVAIVTDCWKTLSKAQML